VVARSAGAAQRSPAPLVAAPDGGRSKGANARLIDFAPHSHTHCILRNEIPSAGGKRSKPPFARWGNGPPSRSACFPNPNGQRGDFGDSDKAVLRAEGIQAAVTGIGGANSSRTELLELKRYPVALYHDDAGFCAEVTGFRSALLAASGRRAS